MLENSLKDNGCKARDRRNTWCIARLSNVADAAFGQYRAIQNANAASETRDRLREKHRQSLVDCRLQFTDSKPFRLLEQFLLQNIV